MCSSAASFIMEYLVGLGWIIFGLCVSTSVPRNAMIPTRMTEVLFNYPLNGGLFEYLYFSCQWNISSVS